MLRTCLGYIDRHFVGSNELVSSIYPQSMNLVRATLTEMPTSNTKDIREAIAVPAGLSDVLIFILVSKELTNGVIPYLQGFQETLNILKTDIGAEQSDSKLIPMAFALMFSFTIIAPLDLLSTDIAHLMKTG